MNENRRFVRDNMQLISSFTNLERRRLKPGCYEGCIHALNSISFRIETMAFLDNFFLETMGKVKPNSSQFFESLAEFFQRNYQETDQLWNVDVSGTVTFETAKTIGLVINELLTVWVRTDSVDEKFVAKLKIKSDSKMLIAEIHLSPPPAGDNIMNSLVIKDLIEQYPGRLNPSEINGQNNWRICLPVSKGVMAASSNMEGERWREY